MKDSEDFSGRKDIVSGKSFLFYWDNKQIEIIKHRDDKIPFMISNKDWLMVFGLGLAINVDKNEESSAWAHNSYWVHP